MADSTNAEIQLGVSTRRDDEIREVDFWSHRKSGVSQAHEEEMVCRFG